MSRLAANGVESYHNLSLYQGTRESFTNYENHEQYVVCTLNIRLQGFGHLWDEAYG